MQLNIDTCLDSIKEKKKKKGGGVAQKDASLTKCCPTLATYARETGEG